jgi:predicted ArsR family transcriptional regulator
MDTNAQAHEAIERSGRADNLRLGVERILSKGSFTADEVAAQLGESPLAVRPRLSELRKENLIRDTGLRRANASGKSAAVWEQVV